MDQNSVIECKNANSQFYPNVQAQRPDHLGQHLLHLSTQPTNINCEISLTNMWSMKYESDLPQHTQKVWQISEAFWLACTDFPVYETCKDSENIYTKHINHDWEFCFSRTSVRAAYHYTKKKEWELSQKKTLISNKRTCFGFASPSIRDVATEEPGWVMWKPIPGTSCK